MGKSDRGNDPADCVLAFAAPRPASGQANAQAMPTRAVSGA